MYKSVLIHFGIALLAIFSIQEWLSGVSGTSPTYSIQVGVLGLLLLAGSAVVGWLRKRPGRYWLLPALLSILIISGLISEDFILALMTSGLLLLYGFGELLWEGLGRIRRGGAFVLFLLLLIPIIAGTWALQSPRCVPEGDDPLGWLHAMFTAVSATTVTGLSVVDIGTELSREGQWILLALIQIGGLGTVTLFILFMTFLGQGLGLRQGRAIREAMNGMDTASVKQLLKPIFVTTVSIQAMGTILLAMSDGYSLVKPSFQHLFHSVSAFCNSGFALHEDSIASFNTLERWTMIALIILGGIGFPVIWELWKRFKSRSNRLGTHVILSLGTSSGLWIFGAIFLILGGATAIDGIFWSVTCRTAGFSVGDVQSLTDYSIMILIILMIIGASPGSTGGGLKTSTIGILMVALYHQIRGRDQVQFNKRTLSDKLIRSAAVLTLMYGLIWLVLLIMLHWTEMNSLEMGTLTQQQLLFEMTSALGTVGLSMDTTGHLSDTGKSLLMVAMILGRLGPLALVVGLSSLTQQGNKIDRPEGKVMLG